MILDIWGQMFSKKEGMMRIMKLDKYRLKAQVEKDEGPSGEGQSPRVEKDEGPEAETLSRLLIVAEGSS